MSKLLIYHGSKDIIEKPYYHGGKAENDYGFGFYCTENLDLAKEWSCSNNENNGFAKKCTFLYLCNLFFYFTVYQFSLAYSRPIFIYYYIQ